MFVYLTSLIGTLGSASQQLQPLILKLDFMCAHPILLYKSCHLLFILGFCKHNLDSLTHKGNLFLLLFRATWDNQLVCYYYWGVTLRLSPQKVSSLINFFDYIAFACLYSRRFAFLWRFHVFCVLLVHMSMLDYFFVVLGCSMKLLGLFDP